MCCRLSQGCAWTACFRQAPCFVDCSAAEGTYGSVRTEQHRSLNDAIKDLLPKGSATSQNLSAVLKKFAGRWIDGYRVTKEEGDSYARYLVIWEELKESARIIRQAIEGMPEGDWRTKFPIKVPPGEAYVNVEWARGCFGFHLVSDGGMGPYRLKMRAPSFANLWAMPEIMKNVKLADVPVIFASLYMCHGDIDR